MFCSKCGKTLMPEDTQCPHCQTPVGESRFEGTPYTSAQAHVKPDTPAGQAAATYTRTTYTTMSEEQQQEGAVDSRTTYRPVYDGASAPEEIRKDMRAAIEGEGGEDADAAQAAPQEPLSEDALNTLNAVEEELKMESVDVSELHSRPIESTGRAGISTEVEDYIQRLEATQSRRAARRRRAYDENEETYATPREGVVYDDNAEVNPDIDTEQSEVFNDIDEEEFDEIRYGRTIGVKDILRVALIMIAAAALIVGGVLWFRHIRGGQASSKIEGVTQALYDDGLTLIKSHTEADYVNEMAGVYSNSGLLAFTQQAGTNASAIDQLTPEEPAVNDPLFISVLQTIQGNLDNAILMDLMEAEQGALNPEQNSDARWAIVRDEIAQVENATTAQELTAVLNGERVTVASAPTPTPEPPPAVEYATLSKGDKSDEVLEMQNRLFMLGFLLDDRAGAFGSKTQTAVKLFQQAAGLEATGIADNQTLTLLYSEDAPRTEYAQVTPTPAVTPEPTPEPIPEAPVEAPAEAAPAA